MSYDDALSLLGIRRDADPREARRAYLRLLKTTSPETDPEGFMRLRSAYELVEQVGAARVTPTGRDATVVMAAVETAPAREPAAPAREPAAPAREPAAPEREPAAPVRESAAEAPDEAQKTSRAEHSPRPWEVEVEREAKAAAPVLVDWFDAAAADPTAPSPPLGAATTVMLELVLRKQLATASSLRASVEDYLGCVRATDTDASDALAWAMADGLWALRKTMSPRLLTAMASAVLSGNPEASLPQLRTFASNHPVPAARLLDTMRRRAPLVADVFGSGLITRRAPVAGPAPVTRSSAKPWLLLFPAMILLRFAAGTSSSSSSVPVSPSSQTYRAVAPPAATHWSGDDELATIIRPARAALSRGDCASARTYQSRAIEALNDKTREFSDTSTHSYVELTHELEVRCPKSTTALPPQSTP